MMRARPCILIALISSLVGWATCASAHCPKSMERSQTSLEAGPQKLSPTVLEISFADIALFEKAFGIFPSQNKQWLNLPPTVPKARAFLFRTGLSPPA